ncbi:MAG: ADP-forming succinate--CoA ligase subunit beta [Candidatus Eisenbacteria bacterium]|nr:ADP-forming succinate--CoA ligase subunit beta [Candidatus Latescibacterota bacterium]MBD3302389.1 ADP-forming succinate--CoA ligase subunit beta [Candidatus Eisenbacteria bacterium]
MNIHEYQAKEIFRNAGIPVPEGTVATTVEQVRDIAARFGTRVVVKAQVHTGGRGKAGGVKLAHNPEEAAGLAEKILGMEIKGHVVRKVLVTPAVDISHEYYLGVVLDRAAGRPLVMVSREGGIDIEEVAKTNPGAILREHFDPSTGLYPFQARQLAYGIEPEPHFAKQIASILIKLCRCFAQVDGSLAEINPLIRTPGGEMIAIDAKINLDDSALFHHHDLEAMRDSSAESANEAAAREMGLSYIKLDGAIGCVVNGAGLAMATMDLVKHFGGSPANFLDIGGSSSPDKVITAIRIITEDQNVKVILFNIFGGITRCDDVANGLIRALSATKVKLPIVARLTGTNEEEARQILGSVEGLTPAETMDEAVQRAVELAR